jgi:hypothetical protein
VSHALAAAAVAVLWSAPHADGASVSLGGVDKYGVFEALFVKAERGESNDVTLTLEGRTVRVVDPGAELLEAEGTNCTQVDLHTVECRQGEYRSFAQARLSLRGGDDRLDATAFTENVHAHGGPGRDELRGGPRDDSLGGGGGNDILDGGAGVDEAEFPKTVRGLRIDLADPRPQGASGSEDVLRDIENVEAGDAAEVLGDAGPNRLIAGPDARVNGRGGDDEIFVIGDGRGLGGRGDDELSVASFAPRTGPIAYSCGEGADVVSTTALTDTVEAGCETVRPNESGRAFEDVRTRLSSRRLATARLDCGFGIYGRQRFQVTVRRGSPSGPVLTRREFGARCPDESEEIHRFPLRLNTRSWRTLREERALRVVIYARAVVDDGRPYGGRPEGFSAVLRAGVPRP